MPKAKKALNKTAGMLVTVLRDRKLITKIVGSP
jgi:hypothetical protein